MFYISAVTISEMTRNDSENMVNAIFYFFNSSGITFVDFSKNIASKISQNVREYLPDYSVNQFISHIQKNTIKPNDIVNIRNWIIDDLKIAASAKSIKKLDVVLTADKNTFKPIAEKLKIPVLETNNIPKDLFDEISSIMGIS
jgi:ethanolamine ammonia-lyase large subunit